MLDERHGRPARERRGDERRRATDTAFAAALRTVCADLAAQIVADGEGATVLAEIAVSGAASDAEAKAIARRIATSPLVKTALFGRDANWGRVLAAAGLGAVQRRLRPTSTRTASRSATTACACSRRARRSGVEPELDGATCRIDLDLGLGDGAASYLTSDLSYDYVRINADYRS